MLNGAKSAGGPAEDCTLRVRGGRVWEALGRSIYCISSVWEALKLNLLYFWCPGRLSVFYVWGVLKRYGGESKSSLGSSEEFLRRV